VSGAGRPEGLYRAAGVWTSDDIDSGTSSTGVYGEIDFAGVDPAAGSLEIRVATSDSANPTDFVGPDGLTSSFWTIGDLPSVLDFDHDEDRYLRVEIRMATSDRVDSSPIVDRISVDYNLPLIARDAGTSAQVVVVDPTASALTTYLARVQTPAGGAVGAAHVDVLGGDWSTLSAGTLRLENSTAGLDAVQWTTAGPSPTPVAFDPGSPHSLVLDHHKSPGADAVVDLRWQLNVDGPGSIFIQGDISVEVRDS
jgi:hypothetical protein